MLVVRKIQEFALATPDAPAIIADLAPISYRAFDGWIGALRRRFAAEGLADGGVAVLWIDDIVASWVIDLALRSLGHTTLSIRTAAELDDLRGLDVIALVTLTGERRPGAARPPNARRLDLDADAWAPGETGGPEPPFADPPGDHVLLTSATTGRYKMVLRTAAQDDAAYEARRASYQQMVEASGGRVVVNYLNAGLWTTAAYPACILIWSFGQTAVIHQGPDLHRSLGVPGVSYTVLTPQMLARILEAPPGSFPRDDRMQLSLVGGSLSERMFLEARKRITDQISSTVGSTEGGTWATTQVKSLEDLRWHRLAPNRKVEVVDENHQPLPPGQLGQVRVDQTPGVSAYLGDGTASAAFFRDGWFYPGDLGVLDGEGRLRLYGRVTDVISVGGDKIPVGPIEERLQAALGVDGVCVLSEQGADAAEALHVVIETAEPIEEAKLKELPLGLGGFPEVHYHFVADLPRNSAGKIERLELRKRLISRR